MQGRKIYEFALKNVPLAMKLCLESSKIDIKDVKKILIHQANEKMDEAIIQRFYKLFNTQVPEGIMPMSIHKLGNSSVATIPTLYDLLKTKRREGIIDKNTTMFLDFSKKEIKIYFDGGRLIRPVLIVNDNKLAITKEVMEDVNTELLSKDYKNNKDILKYICKCGKNKEITFKKYLVERCCDECHKKTLSRIFKYTYDEVKTYFQDNNCELISIEYKNNKNLLEYLCECKNKAKISFKAFQSGQR